MGKISNALEKNKKEKSMKIESLPKKTPKPLVIEDPETSLAKDIGKRHDFSHKLVVISSPNSVDAENFKILRGKILFSRDRERPKSIMVTSAFPSEGKTFVSANLAVSMALGIDEHVLLIDCDLRRPSLHEVLGYRNSEGLHEYLTGKRELKDLIIRTEIDKLSMLTAGTLPSNPMELLSSSRMQEFLEEVKVRYQDRFIIIDSPPSQAAAETNILAKDVDGIILVVRAQKSPRNAIEKTIHDVGKEKILGVFFNDYFQAYRSYHKYYKKYYSIEK